MKLLQRRCDTMALTSRVRIAVCLALGQHPCPLRLLRRHLSQSERLWQSGTFSSKRKSVSSKTKPLCQGLPCQERLPRPGEVARKCRKGNGWRAIARLRGWTKDAFRLSEDDGEVLQRFRESWKRIKFQKLPPTQPGQSYLFFRPASVSHGLADTNL